VLKVRDRWLEAVQIQTLPQFLNNPLKVRLERRYS
jgi:hypothetical protein